MRTGVMSMQGGRGNDAAEDASRGARPGGWNGGWGMGFLSRRGAVGLRATRELSRLGTQAAGMTAGRPVRICAWLGGARAGGSVRSRETRGKGGRAGSSGTGTGGGLGVAGERLRGAGKGRDGGARLRCTRAQLAD